jgi:hypothetical protein
MACFDQLDIPSYPPAGMVFPALNLVCLMIVPMTLKESDYNKSGRKGQIYCI